MIFSNTWIFFSMPFGIHSLSLYLIHPCLKFSTKFYNNLIIISAVVFRYTVYGYVSLIPTNLWIRIEKLLADESILL